MRGRLQQMMIGRYGVDELARMLNFVILAVLLLGLLLPPLSWLGIALILVQNARIFSRNFDKRARENMQYIRIRYQFIGWVRNTKERIAQSRVYRFYRCPTCRQTLRVPRGKGKLSITCPKCRIKFVKKT